LSADLSSELTYYSPLIGTFSSIWAHEGFRGFYRGLGPTIIGYLPTWAIYFTVYDKVKVKMGALRGELTDALFPGG